MAVPSINHMLSTSLNLCPSLSMVRMRAVPFVVRVPAWLLGQLEFMILEEDVGQAALILRQKTPKQTHCIWNVKIRAKPTVLVFFSWSHLDRSLYLFESFFF